MLSVNIKKIFERLEETGSGSQEHNVQFIYYFMIILSSLLVFLEHVCCYCAPSTRSKLKLKAQT